LSKKEKETDKVVQDDRDEKPGWRLLPPTLAATCVVLDAIPLPDHNSSSFFVEDFLDLQERNQGNFKARNRSGNTKKIRT